MPVQTPSQVPVTTVFILKVYEVDAKLQKHLVGVAGIVRSVAEAHEWAKRGGEKADPLRGWSEIPIGLPNLESGNGY